MKAISGSLANHLAGEVTTLATCWKLTRRDDVVMGFTDHDVDVVFEGVTYLATAGMTASAVSASNALRVDELEVEGLLSAEAISQEDIFKGLYDYAQVEVFVLNYNAPESGKLQLRHGWFGEVTLKGEQFVAEIRGLSQALQQPIGEIFSPGCRAILGDGRCKVNMAAHTFSGVVSVVHELHGVTAAALTKPDGYFTAGMVRFTTGVNAGVIAEVKYYNDKRFYFVEPLRKACVVGDTFVATAGCDKTTVTCKERFNNILNFRGEPHVPGTDRVFETAATRSEW